ncbi:MAG: hypothetical protein ACREQI_10720 [Candidatus Binataceae bacterium]
MRRSGAKSLAAKESARVRVSAGAKRTSKSGRVNAQARVKRIANGGKTLKRLFADGAEIFKRLDTATIVRIAEDKELEYL